MKKHVFKAGDKVRIINPEFMTRVGYSLTPQIVVDEIRNNPDQIKLIRDFLNTFGLGAGPSEFLLNTNEADWYDDIIYRLAYRTVKKRGFGGSERKIFVERKEECLNQIFRVFTKKVVRTGVYQSGSGGYDYWGEYDYCPAYLENVKSHVLLEVYPDDNCLKIEGCGVFIEEKNVELVLNNDLSLAEK